MIQGEKRQIVRPVREAFGILSGFGLFEWGLIGVRRRVAAFLPQNLRMISKSPLGHMVFTLRRSHVLAT